MTDVWKQVSCCVVYLQEWTATADFTHHAHTASVSAVATSERYIATGSRDETIQIYDMKKRVEHGALLHHNGKRHDTKKRDRTWSSAASGVFISRTLYQNV